MAQSLSKVILHIIFSTKRPRTVAYARGTTERACLSGTVSRKLNAELVHVGGVTDHVHIVTTLPRTLSQAQLVEQIKKTSSKWIKTLGPRWRGFFWQRGYAAFSVSPSQLEAVLRYIAGKASTIARARFSMNIANYCAGTELISMSGTCGIDNHLVN
jgi:REP element-mobilizing transposase RayT